MDKGRRSISLKRQSQNFTPEPSQPFSINLKQIMRTHASHTKKNKLKNAYSCTNRDGNMDMIIPSLACGNSGPNYKAILADQSLFQENAFVRPATTALKRRKVEQTEEGNTKLSKYLSEIQTPLKNNKYNPSTGRKVGLSFQFLSNQMDPPKNRRASLTNTDLQRVFKSQGHKQKIDDILNGDSISKLQKQRTKGKNIEFILRRKKGMNFEEAMKQYCQRMKIPENSRIFVFKSEDSHIKKALIKRGWIENKDPQSTLFHLKWSAKITNTKKLNPHQYFNHFEESDLLTSKEGLMKIIRPCKQLRKTIPRTFDLGRQKQIFVDNFMQTQILCGVKKIVSCFTQKLKAKIKIIEPNKLKKFFSQMRTENDYQKIHQIQEKSLVLHIPYCVQMLALCENIRCRLEGDRLDNCNALHIKTLRNLMAFCKLNPPYDEYIKSRSTNNECSPNLTQHQKIIFDQNDINMYSASESFGHPSPALQSLLVSYHHYFTQNLNTYAVEGEKNIWIVKNRNSSKGVGISLHSSLDEILKKSENKIAQKYIEECVTYCFDGENRKMQKKYKFDLRVWVLVQSFTPLKAYFFNDFYCRICSKSYDLDDLDKLEGHLTNFSVNKKFFRPQEADYSVISKKSMLKNLLQQHIDEELQQNQAVLNNELYQKMEATIDGQLGQLIKITLGQYSGLFTANNFSKNCFELYGFDVLFSEKVRKKGEEKGQQFPGFNLHLLEVNLSPACKERAEWLNDNLKNMSQSLIDLIMDKEDFRPEEGDLQPSKHKDSPLKFWTKI